VRLFNDGGACLAGAVLSDDILKGVMQLTSGAWYHPQDYGTPGSLDLHGNPNMLTRDEGTSFLGQGPSAQSVLVEIENSPRLLNPVNSRCLECEIDRAVEPTFSDTVISALIGR
jgi:biotin/methionine sulfoxide reductase